MTARNHPIKNLKGKAVVKTVKKTAPAIPKSVLNRVRDGMREASRGLGSLYFECRVMVSPIAKPPERIEVTKIASMHDFRFEVVGDDLILATTKLDRAKEQLASLHKDLIDKGYKIWRYRISEVMTDSNNFDSLGLL